MDARLPRSTARARGQASSWTLSSSMLVLLTLTAGPAAAQASVDWTPVARALGKSGSVVAGNVYKVGFPRSDLRVEVDGVPVAPALALGSWVGLMETTPGRAVAMGDLVLREPEVGDVIRRLQEGGVEVTALHNHLVRESPALRYLHIRAVGDPVAIAATIHAALAHTGTPFGPATASPPLANLDTAAIRRALGRPGVMNGGVFQVAVPRADTVTEDGMVIPPALGTAISLNFQATAPGRAAITGDFALLAREVSPVTRALTQNGIEVTAIHSHMLDERPRLVYVHFWANDDALKLARGLRAALDRVHSAPAR